MTFCQNPSSSSLYSLNPVLKKELVITSAAQLVQSSNLKLAAQRTCRSGSIVKRRQNLKAIFTKLTGAKDTKMLNQNQKDVWKYLKPAVHLKYSWNFRKLLFKRDEFCVHFC
jgi:hypothetical protein